MLITWCLAGKRLGSWNMEPGQYEAKSLNFCQNSSRRFLLWTLIHTLLLSQQRFDQGLYSSCTTDVIVLLYVNSYRFLYSFSPEVWSHELCKSDGSADFNTGTSKKIYNIMKMVNIFCHSFQKVKPIYYIDSLHIEWIYFKPLFLDILMIMAYR